MKEFKRVAKLLLPDMMLIKQGLKNHLSCFKQLKNWTKYLKQQLSDTEQQAQRTVLPETGNKVSPTSA